MRRSDKIDSEDYTDQFKPWSHNDSEPIFHSDETVRLCSHSNRKSGLQTVGNKYQKRETDKTIKQNHYFCVKKITADLKILK